ncbi:hypothetical protein BD324DRAFT_448681 [Kockovaella imperatae]|uniref:Uncharacterized protein n=1 Tax=Kockovaella imperatae TaxID=4999 RepID=A0A1Y1UJW3_9TREE|nr:hypothetical protein BD324DRAFT_448681 [Kockovaella imperatae]ORX37415.1 hypothetical protein BD324DRAFT_448681 [Kockovaella imperatae]
MASTRPKPPTRSNSGLTPDGSTTTVKAPSPLRSSTVPIPTKEAAAAPPARPQRPPESTIPQSIRVMDEEPRSAGSSLAPSPTIITKASKEPVSVVQAQTHEVSGGPTSAAMTRSVARSPALESSHPLSAGLVAPKAARNGAPRLSILEPSPTLLSDDWMSDFDSASSSFDFDDISPSPTSTLAAFPPAPSGRLDIQPVPRSAPPTQTKLKISIPVPIDLDTDPRLVGKSRYGAGSRSATSTPVIDYVSPLSKSPNSYGAQGLPKSLQSFPPRIPLNTRSSPKSRSNSLPGEDEDVPRPYGRASPTPIQMGLTQSASDSTAFDLPRKAPSIPSVQPSSSTGRVVIQPEDTNVMDAEVASRRVQGYRQSISARYAHKLQAQPQKPVIQQVAKAAPQIVQGDFGAPGRGGEHEEEEGWVGFAV